LKYDGLVIGAGLTGLAVAYHIKKRRPQDNILVIDMKSAAGQGDTAKSGMMFRTFFHSKHNLLLADTSINFYEHVQRNLGFNLDMEYIGYLFLFSYKDEVKQKWIKETLNLMKQRGLKYKIYDGKELAEKIDINVEVEADAEAKIMRLKNIDFGVFIPKAGFVDANSLVNFYEHEFLRLGGKIQFNTKALGIRIAPRKKLGIPGEPYFWQESRATGVYTSNMQIKARKTIIAAGAWINELLDPVGINPLVKPWGTHVFVLKAKSSSLRKLLLTPGFNSQNSLPFTILPSGIYLNARPKENVFWTGCDDITFGRPFRFEEEPPIEKRFYEYGLYPVLSKYFPQFINVHPSSAWTGRLDVNTYDQQPVIFEKNDLIIVTGLTGNGLMKADAVGRITAALYMGKKHAELFGGERVEISDFGIEKRSVERETFALI